MLLIMTNPTNAELDAALNRWLRIRDKVDIVSMHNIAKRPVDCMGQMLEIKPSDLAPFERPIYHEFMEATLDYVRLTAFPGTSHSAPLECMPVIELLMNGCADRLIEMHGPTKLGSSQESLNSPRS